ARVAGAAMTTVALVAALAISTPAFATSRTAMATVERRDLVERENGDGTVGYGTPYEIDSPRVGGVTRLPRGGTIVERGQWLYDISASPVPVIYGSVPLYRDLESGVSYGADVQQLEENLAALGYGDSLTVDAHFDHATTAAVKAWQS